MLEALAGTILDNLDAVLGKYALCMEAPEQQRKPREKLEQKILCKKLERTRLSDFSCGLYENLTLGVIGKDEYYSLQERYDAQLAQVNEDLQPLKRGSKSISSSGGTRRVSERTGR